MVAPAMKGAMGNCYAQLGQLDKAASMLLKAANEADNNSLSPIYLLQAGEILVKQGKYDDAIQAYTTIKINTSVHTRQWISISISNKPNY